MTAEVIQLGREDYTKVFDAMKAMTAAAALVPVPDQFWLVEHPPVFTLGLAGSANICCATSAYRWWKVIAAAR